MKYLSATTILLFPLSVVFGQTYTNSVYLQYKSKFSLYYVELNNSDAKVYQMGSYLDKAGSGYSIRKTDTLLKRSDGAYLGKSSQIVTEKNEMYLITQYKKTQKFNLTPVANTTTVYTNLNNAYYLGSFFAMCDELNRTYTLNHYSFRNGFYSWKELPNKEMEHSQFRIYADARLKDIKDSISRVQDQYVSLTNNLIQNITAIDYTTLKDSLVKLPVQFRGSGWYFGSVVNELSKQKPEFFFRLAEDMPGNRDVIFAAAEDDKNVIQGLKAVENHDAIKKEFFKDRKFGKTMPYRIIGGYALVIGALALLIASQ